MLFVSLLTGLVASTLVVADTITVQVGGDSSGPALSFSPSSVNATEGTVINFQFTGEPGNHTVTQSSFASPCTPLSGGFDSGWVFIPEAGVSPTPEWNVTITNATAPIWFYCKQLQKAPHCTAGMVGAINAPGTGAKTFDAFQAAAKAFSGSVGQDQGFLAGVGASASADPGPLASGVSLFGAPNPTATAPSGTGSGGSGSNSSGTSSATAGSPSTSTKSNSAFATAFSPFVVLVAVVMGFTITSV